MAADNTFYDIIAMTYVVKLEDAHTQIHIRSRKTRAVNRLTAFSQTDGHSDILTENSSNISFIFFLY